jgi:hypothetical protein
LLSKKLYVAGTIDLLVAVEGTGAAEVSEQGAAAGNRALQILLNLIISSEL